MIIYNENTTLGLYIAENWQEMSGGGFKINLRMK